MQRYLPALCLVILLLPGCKKRWFDYRNKYCGTWKLSYTIQSWTGQNGYSAPVTGELTTTVHYDKHGSKDIIYLSFAPGLDSVFTVAHDGHFNACGSTGGFDSSKKLHLTYCTCSCGGGLGGGTGYTITGIKQ